MHHTLARCKQRLPLPELLVRLGLFANPPGSGSHPCPIHRERKGAAFSIRFTRDVWLWICHGKCGVGGDEISFLETFNGLSRRDAIVRYKELCGLSSDAPPLPKGPELSYRGSQTPSSQTLIVLSDTLSAGSYLDCEQVARLRRVPVATTTAMSKDGLLVFGRVCGFPSWIVLDASRKLAEARRMDGGFTQS
jgi:hypothetical protein